METEIEKYSCPICRTETPPNPRYPNLVCRSCAGKAVSADGRRLEFYNVGLAGGYSAIYSDSKEVYDSHECFIEGVKCRADEARFGGIVVERCITFEERIRGGIVGLLVGDALGVPYEFHPKESIPPFEQIEFEPPPGFRRAHAGVPVGTWSDDGAQALCLLASLLECGKFDAADFAEKLVAWFQQDYMAVDGVFDVGIQTQRAILNLRKGLAPLEAGLRDEKNNGNGSLMRVLPLALWHQGTDEELVKDAFDQSAVTHGHLRSKLCCALYCLWARNFLLEVRRPYQQAETDLKKIFERDAEAHKELQILFDFDWKNLNGSGYVVDSLFSAVYCCWEDSYEEAVKAAISFGNDTDTTAAIAGGIAGLRFGVGGIPGRWRENLRGREIYEPLLEKLLERL
jgi:ADP-ribosylglycohydrolase